MNDTTATTLNTVSVTVAPNGSGGVTITCTPDPAHVGAHNTLITFSLDTAGYNFPATNAIVLAAPSPDFPMPARTVNPTMATLLDLCNTVASFKYSVFIVDTATGVGYSVDPVIKNGDASCQP